MRIGDLLHGEGVIGGADLDAAVSEQLMTRAAEHAAGGAPTARLGSILYRRGLVPADVLARALARQLGVHAALGRHLEQRDPALVSLVPEELARRFVALPVAQARSADGMALIVCMRDPTDPAALALLARAARLPIVPAVACEAVLAPLVARAYATSARAVVPARAAAAGAAAPAPDPDAVESVDVDLEDTGPVSVPIDTDDAAAADPLDAGTLTLVDLDDRGVARDPSQISSPGTRPPPFGAGAASGGSAASGASGDDGWRITGERAAVLPPPDVAPAVAPAPPAPHAAGAHPRAPTAPPLAAAAPAPAPAPAPFVPVGETIARIGAAAHRDEIAEAMVAHLAGRFAAGVVFVVRDGLALGQRGYGGLLSPAAVEALVVPLSQPSVLRAAHDARAPFEGAPTETSVVQDRFLRAVGYPHGGDREVTVVPVAVKERIVCLVFAHGLLPGRHAGDVIAELLELARAMELAFVRLIRDAKRITHPGL